MHNFKVKWVLFVLYYKFLLHKTGLLNPSTKNSEVIPPMIKILVFFYRRTFF